MRSRPLPQLSRTQELMCTLSRLIQGKMLLPGITVSQLFVYVRDAAFFKMLFFSEDRANDLTLVKNQEIMGFPRNDGLLFNHVFRRRLWSAYISPPN